MIRFGWVDTEVDVVLLLIRADGCWNDGWNDGGGCVALVAQNPEKGKGRGVMISWMFFFCFFLRGVGEGVCIIVDVCPGMKRVREESILRQGLFYRSFFLSLWWQSHPRPPPPPAPCSRNKNQRKKK